ncbi:MAG: ATP-binding protein [Roseibium album]|uniref:ATP-binding protein n=1 Tax=Stappiaceae TaxID=2821832 RepID=UPI0012EB10E2|nr:MULTISPECIES: ATP-binding protein [Stappiaceae]MBG6146509.1 anti-sigma regulatory factor (Ser/Thr protein kinase) [Labrenzia sp. EL_142]MBG6173484.1 anti-sigma regulatory factor (Ser/Thr protein kinase) [Labrenzia sp. EL_132]MBG6202251.1 anti-sigma regulatory factor (Ser/Thr protein kinase) [Labrenzia sp. EL_13]MBG6208415.1 anti-sigma regulatory factor (Ser/Thr protein kinase) [Labrenzia sp. EL_126]MBG6227746.1 anti-sigma regulatory factor (Ser/Thr protein kinase) [Labrenzia sp. EL_208]MCR
MRNDLSEMGTVSTTLDDIGTRFTLPCKAVMQVQIALDEALSNIVKYAWPEGGEHEALVKIAVLPDQLKIQIIDDGQPFDISQIRTVLPAPGDSRKKYGGRGIIMLKKLVDNIEYDRKNGRNYLTLSKTTSPLQ